jgi:hypothetical protein
VPRPLAQRRLLDDSKRLSIIRFVTGHHFSGAEAQRDLTLAERHFRSDIWRRKSPLHAPAFIRLWHLSSLDAPTVALVWCIAFAWTVNVRLPWWVLVLLSLGVWAVYVADRLLDARGSMRTLKVEQLHERHFFHWHHRRILAPMAAACALTATWIVFEVMPRATREHDSLLAAASVLYFTRVHTGRRILPLLSKESLVGILFTLGCAIPTFTRAHFSPEFPVSTLLITTALFWLLAWLNCYAIDRWETHGTPTPRNPISLLALSLAAASLICSILLAASHPASAILLACGAMAALLLAALNRVRAQLDPVTLRAAADFALLTPLLLFALAPLLRK